VNIRKPLSVEKKIFPMQISESLFQLKKKYFQCKYEEASFS